MTRSAAQNAENGSSFEATEPPASGFATVVALAMRFFGVPMARVVLFLPQEPQAAGPPSLISFLQAQLFAGAGPIVVPDVLADPRFAALPEVDAGHLRFVAAALLPGDDRAPAGMLLIADHAPRTVAAAAADAPHLASLAALAGDGLARRAAEERLQTGIAEGRSAIDRLALADALTEAALAAPDFSAAIRTCLMVAAQHVAADAACAHGMPLRAAGVTNLEIDAGYLAEGQDDLAVLIEALHRSFAQRANKIVSRALLEGHAIVLPDLATISARNFPVLASLGRESGVRCAFIVPFTDGGMRFAVTFLFRRRPADLEGLAATMQSLSGKVRDLLARRRVEISLREREVALRRLADRQAAMLDALPAHVALLDGNGAIVEVGKSWTSFARAAGRPATARGDSYLAFIAASCAPGQIDAVTKGIRSVLDGTRLQFGCDFLCNHAGRYAWYRLVLAPIAHSPAQGAVAMHLDITDSKLAVEALRREKEFSEFLIKSTTEGILVFDVQYRITMWNPGIAAITGLAQEDVLGRSAFEVLPTLVGTAAERAIKGVLDGRETSFYDERYAVPETGREGYYEGYFSPRHSENRQVVGGIGFLRETTERRRIEDALRQSQKMEAVGQLTGGIAHDFNNMLTVIAGNLELLEGRLGAEPRLLRLVNSATLAASRAEKLTQQLLTFSRRQQLRPQVIDFNQIIIGMDDLLHRTVDEPIEIRTSLSPELWPAFADPNQIETVLLNLVLNARDAMPDGGRITLETGNAEIANSSAENGVTHYATLAVIDTGQGMSEEVLAHVFEPFFTTKEVGKGTGLGLSQVYGFIKQSAGHIKIESRIGAGTAVRLYLPRAQGVADAYDTTPMREPHHRGSELVLVVEDDHGVRDFAGSVLRELGYRVLEAANGDDALETINTHPDIDLLFTDVVMPGRLHGVDLARAARERRPELRVLFTSGYPTRLIEKEWPEHSVELLRKPYRSLDLAERVRAVLDHAAHVTQ